MHKLQKENLYKQSKIALEYSFQITILYNSLTSSLKLTHKLILMSKSLNLRMV
jgi:hypothetical protein